MYYLHAIQSINHQSVFQTDFQLSELSQLEADSEIQAPDYKLFIQPAALRRLSALLRMSITCGKVCQEQVEKPFHAISFGTSLGCLTDTEKFLKVIHSVQGDVLSPTAFIQSTHNTLAGQISIELGNHGYNMTHTQNALSFEMALIDGMLCADEAPSEVVLVGAADESIPFLAQLKPSLIPENKLMTNGVTTMVIGKEKGETALAITSCEIRQVSATIEATFNDYLEEIGMQVTDFKSVFVAGNQLKIENSVSIDAYIGSFDTNSAFGIHLAQQRLANEKEGKVMVVNAHATQSLAFILVQKSGA